MGNGNEPKLDGKKSFSVIGANEEFQLQNVKYNDMNQGECKNDLGVIKIWEANDKQNRDIFAYFSPLVLVNSFFYLNMILSFIRSQGVF